MKCMSPCTSDLKVQSSLTASAIVLFPARGSLYVGLASHPGGEGGPEILPVDSCYKNHISSSRLGQRLVCDFALLHILLNNITLILKTHQSIMASSLNK